LHWAGIKLLPFPADGALVPEPVQQVFERVRNNADFMPAWQMERVLEEELGIEWRKKLKEFDPRPLAAASIGQVSLSIGNKVDCIVCMDLLSFFMYCKEVVITVLVTAPLRAFLGQHC